MSVPAQGQCARHRHAGGVADAQSPARHAECRSRICCTGQEMNLRRRARRAADEHISEGDSGAEARAERLEHRFFGGEPSRQPFDPIGSVPDFIEFGLHKTARDKGVAWVLDPALQLSDVHEIYAMSNYVHEAALLKVTNHNAPGTTEGLENDRESGTRKR